uniref:Uncharacterized protein n=1 Tax=Amphimedon queenslandica TaxID=400682 RepID=A0A1X7U5N6_AMPQE
LRDGHRVTGTKRSEWHLYDKIDAILGTTASSNPALVLVGGALEASITQTKVSSLDKQNDSGKSRSTSAKNNITEGTSTQQETNSHPETTSDEATSIVMTLLVTTKRKGFGNQIKVTS